MKYILMLTIVASLLLVGCGGPPKSLPKAVVTEPVMEQPVIEEPAPVVTKPPVDVAMESGDSGLSGSHPLNKARSSFSFEGFAPGKSHIGTFTNWDGLLTFADGVVIGAEGIIISNSVKTDSTRLDSHLMTADFFDVKEYPTMEFRGDVSAGSMTGSLTFHGITKQITFPVEPIENGIIADFKISMKDYGISYTGVNDEVRIFFEMSA